MRHVWHGVVEFVVGDDIWIAAAVAVLLALAGLLVHVGAEAWFILPVGVPLAVWLSLRRATRNAGGAP